MTIDPHGKKRGVGPTLAKVSESAFFENQPHPIPSLARKSVRRKKQDVISTVQNLLVSSSFFGRPGKSRPVCRLSGTADDIPTCAASGAKKVVPNALLGPGGARLSGRSPGRSFWSGNPQIEEKFSTFMLLFVISHRLASSAQFKSGKRLDFRYPDN